MIPTPVLATLLLRAGRATDAQLRRIEARRAFQVQAFDVRAADERARQIVAIARVSGAARIYGDDAALRALGRRHGLGVVGIAELPLPAQGRLDLGEPRA